MSDDDGEGRHVPDEVEMHHAPHESIEDIRRRAAKLIADEKIDKDAAIGVLRLLHDLETLLLRAQHEKETENQKLRNQLEVAQLTQKHAQMLESLSVDVAKLRRDSDTRDAELKRMDSNLQQVSSAMTKKK